MPKVTVLVVGGRPFPQLFRIWAEKPDLVEIIASDESRQECDLIRAALERPPAPIRVMEPHYRPARDIEVALEVCQQLIERHRDDEVVVDITSSEKLMSFGAFIAARKAGVRVVVVDTAGGRIVDVAAAASAPFRVPLAVEEYLRLWGRDMIRKFDPGGLSCPVAHAVSVAQMLGRNAAAHALLHRIRQQGAAGGFPCVVRCEIGADARAEHGVLRQLESQGFIQRLHQVGDGIAQFRVRSGGEWGFLTGTWLEMYLWDQAQQIPDGPDRRLMDCAEFNIAIPQDGAEREIDFACTRNACMVIASCKTEARWWKKEHLDELAAVRRLIGDSYTTALFVVSGIRPPDCDEHLSSACQQFLEQARQQRILVITGDKLRCIGEILRREMLTPSYPRR